MVGDENPEFVSRNLGNLLGRHLHESPKRCIEKFKHAKCAPIAGLPEIGFFACAKSGKKNPTCDAGDRAGLLFGIGIDRDRGA
jgi:hypothetical protein